METPTQSPSSSWQHALEAADEEAFRQLVEPHVEMLLGEPETWHVMMMRDAFGLSLPVVSFVLDRAVNEVAQVLDEARATYRERVVAVPSIKEADEPLPSDELEKK
jgi:hypothetical protein